MLVCGEPSGDALGAQLMAGLKTLAGDRVRFTGIGGIAMEREGLKSLFPLDATAVMGLREVVPAIPAILRRVKQAVDFAVETKPDAVVVIDSPDFTHRVARAIRKRDPSIRTVDYVAPQVWASRAYRAGCECVAIASNDAARTPMLGPSRPGLITRTLAGASRMSAIDNVRHSPSPSCAGPDTIARSRARVSAT